MADEQQPVVVIAYDEQYGQWAERLCAIIKHNPIRIRKKLMSPCLLPEDTLKDSTKQDLLVIIEPSIDSKEPLIKALDKAGIMTKSINAHTTRKIDLNAFFERRAYEEFKAITPRIIVVHVHHPVFDLTYLYRGIVQTPRDVIGNIKPLTDWDNPEKPIADIAATILSAVGLHPKLPRKPAPAFIGVKDGRVALVEREPIEDERQSLRAKLLPEQERLAGWLIQAWPNANVDQRLLAHLKNYRKLCRGEPAKVDIFNLDAEFRVLARCLNQDAPALGDIGETQWQSLARNHTVLTAIDPLMEEYREELAAQNPTRELDEAAAAAAIAVLKEPSATAVVETAVPDLIEKRADEKPSDAEERKKRGYDVAALLTKVGATSKQLPELEKRAEAATSLWNRFWPLLQAIWKSMDW